MPVERKQKIIDFRRFQNLKRMFKILLNSEVSLFERSKRSHQVRLGHALEESSVTKQPYEFLRLSQTPLHPILYSYLARRKCYLLLHKFVRLSTNHPEARVETATIESVRSLNCVAVATKGILASFGVHSITS